MKRSPLKRTTPLTSKSPMVRKRRKGDRPELRTRWLKTQHRCMACWMPKFLNLPLFVHHILQAAKRIDNEANFFALCRNCHGRYHGERIFVGDSLTRLWPALTLAQILGLKAEQDPTALAWLAQHATRQLPEPEPIGAEFLALRRRWA
jgi:hypothetical protein